MSHTQSKSSVRQPPHSPAGMSANANIKFKICFLKTDNTQCQCGHNETGRLRHSTGDVSNALLLESHLARGVKDYKDAWKLI